MDIRGYLQTSLIEWPGKISSVIFVSGCNFRCPFCHNADLVNPKKIKKLSAIPEGEILADLKKRKKWIDGVAITGGEPTLQKDLDRFLKEIKQMGFEAMVETNGSLPKILSTLLGNKLVDYVAMDFKVPLDMNYSRTVRKKNLDVEIITQSMKLLIGSKIPIEFRTTVVPGIHDEKTLVKMAKQIKELTKEPKDKRTKELIWVLQTFRPKNCLDPDFNQKKPYNRLEMKKFLKAVKKIIPGARLRES